MPMSSTQIAAMTSQFQQQAMMQSQASAMISQGAGYGGGMSTMGEQIAGSAINRGAAIGAPVATGAMALAGVDPVSMGLRGALAGGARMGMMGAVGGGLLGAGAVGLPLMAAQYAGGQMMQGMQQQQMLQSTLGQTFRFQNQFGGTGFTSTEMGSIGSMFRGMAQQRGPGGELTSFNELTQLAANMGRMGMAGNIRNVREFQDKFKEMLSTVKEVATAFSTSLEEAQQIMVGMRQSGVFRNQGQVAQEVRAMALTGGLATSEVTGMMRVGSQISRMIGGRGQAGAMAGMRAIGNVGGALQAGTMSEEDIYNVTGLTGAEGRRAMATTMLQGEARFLKSSLGRRMVAALGAQGGQVNQQAIDELMMGGGFGTGRTMQLAHQNLAKMGRADFIRNEGRIRGEIMRQTGGMGHIMAMRGWLEQRGLGMDDDRALIFMQRRLGMGTDEAEQMLRMTRDLPMIMRQREVALGEAEYRQEIQQMRSRTGIQGVKKKLEDARGKIQGTLRQWGSNLYEAASDRIDRLINDITGDVHQYIAHDVEALSRDVFAAGGAAGQQALGRIGIGPQAARVGGFDVAGMQQRMFGGMRRVGMAQAMERAGDFERFEQAGFRIASRTDQGIQQELAHVRKVTGGFRTGYGAQGGRYRDVGRKYKDEFLAAAASGRISGSGMARLASFEKFLSQSRDPQAQRIAMEMAGATDEQKARIMGDVMRSAGLGDTEASLMGGGLDAQALFDQRGFRTAREQHEAIGSAMFGRRGKRRGTAPTGPGAPAEEEGVSGWDIAAGVAMTTPIGMVYGAGYFVADALGAFDATEETFEGTPKTLEMTGAQRRLAGSIMMDRETLMRSRTILGQDADAKTALTRKLRRENAQMLASKGVQGDVRNLGEMRAQFEVNQAQIAASELSTYMQENQVSIDEIPAEKLQEIAGRTGYKNVDAMKDAANAVAGTVRFEEEQAREQAMQRAGRRARGQLRQAQGEAGFITGGGAAAGEIRAGVRKRLAGIGEGRGVVGVEQGGGGAIMTRKVSAGEALAIQYGQAMELQAQLGPGSDERDILQARARQQQAMKTLTGMSIAEKREFAQATAGVAGLEGVRGMAMRQAGIQQRLQRYGARGALGRGVGFARELGVQLSREERRGLGKMGVEEQSQLLASRLGAGLEPQQQQQLQQQIQEAMQQAQKGKVGDAARAVDELQGSSLVKEAKQKQQEERTKERDPSYRALLGIEEAISGTLKVQVQGPVQTIEGGEGDAEGKDTGGK